MMLVVIGYMKDRKPFCFGLEIERGKVIQAPPIARWTMGKKIEKVTHYYTQRHGANIQVIPMVKE